MEVELLGEVWGQAFSQQLEPPSSGIALWPVTMSP
jgi:hypothetical protein